MFSECALNREGLDHSLDTEGGAMVPPRTTAIRGAKIAMEVLEHTMAGECHSRTSSSSSFIQRIIDFEFIENLLHIL